MNFFAHYYFYNKPGEHWHNAGLLFPDLLRIFTHNQRITEKDIKGYKGVGPSHPLAEGIKYHFLADHIFHNWDWFKEKNHSLALSIRNSDHPLERDWFLAHIFIELAIDHVLVSQKESMVSDLYTDLAACNEKEWVEFFEERKLSEAKIWYEGYKRFCEHRYIFTYKDTHNVIYALDRIYERTGIGKFTDAQFGFLVVLLNDFIPEVKLKILELRKLLE